MEAENRQIEDETYGPWGFLLNLMDIPDFQFFRVTILKWPKKENMSCAAAKHSPC